MTSFLLRTENAEVILTTIHHNGTAFMPIHDGIIVPNDIRYLTEVASILTPMGDRNEFRFPIDKCKVYGPQQIGCSNGSSQKFGNHEMSALYLMTSKINEQAFGESFDQLKVTLSVYIRGFSPVQDITMLYSTNECAMNF